MILNAEIFPNRMGWTVEIPGLGEAEVWAKNCGRKAFRVNITKKGHFEADWRYTCPVQVNDPVQAVLRALQAHELVVPSQALTTPLVG